MQNKCNKIYSLFTNGVVLSKDTVINAITPYEVIFRANVLGIEDIVAHFKDKYSCIQNIPSSTLYLYTNPATQESWYFGKNLIAYCDEKVKNYYGDTVPTILAVFNSSTIVLKGGNIDLYLKIKDALTYTTYLHSKSFSMGIISVNDIGYLSYPDRAVVNNSINSSSVKLPLQI